MTTIEQWSQLTDANGQPYDPRSVLSAVRGGDANSGYDELWMRVHHQGDLGTAAYAAVPMLLDITRHSATPEWRAYALVATVEEQRHRPGNPPMPEWLAENYRSALASSLDAALAHLREADDDEAVRSIFAVLAHSKGQRSLAAIALWTEDERLEALGEL